MACYLCFFQCSKSWIALLIPTLAVFASFSVALSVLLILLSSLIFSKFSKQKPIFLDKIKFQEQPPRTALEFSTQEKQPLAVQENILCSFSELLQGERDMIVQKKEQEEENGKGFLIRSQDIYSESESMNQYSSSNSSEDHSDIERIYNKEQRQADCSVGSISDEESLIEIALPSGQFVSLEKDPKLNLKCKLSADFTSEAIFQKHSTRDFLADINEMNEEDNLIEIDIYMGSIKCSTFEIKPQQNSSERKRKILSHNAVND